MWHHDQIAEEEEEEDEIKSVLKSIANRLRKEEEDDDEDQKKRRRRKKKYNCEDCSFSTDHKVLLRSHLRDDHKEEDEEEEHDENDNNVESSTSFVCKICHYSAKSADHLSLHYAVNHEKLVLYCCSFCPAAYEAKAELQEHAERSHPFVAAWVQAMKHSRESCTLNEETIDKSILD